jgi:SNF family Na+-dependent transporter
MIEKPEPDHWLARPETIRKLWIALIAFLAALLVGGAVFPVHGHFGLDETFGFAAWFGFLSCVFLVVGAKAIAIFLKRPDTSYDD